jgi:hypothetical protein
MSRPRAALADESFVDLLDVHVDRDLTTTTASTAKNGCAAVSL